MKFLKTTLIQKQLETRGWELLKKLIDSADLTKEDKWAIQAILNPHGLRE